MTDNHLNIGHYMVTYYYCSNSNIVIIKCFKIMVFIDYYFIRKGFIMFMVVFDFITFLIVAS